MHLQFWWNHFVLDELWMWAHSLETNILILIANLLLSIFNTRVKLLSRVLNILFHYLFLTYMQSLLFCISCCNRMLQWFLCILSYSGFHPTGFDNRTSSSEVPQRKSLATPRTARQLKLPGSDSDSVSSAASPMNKTPKGSPKVVERKSPRSPALEVLSYYLYNWYCFNLVSYCIGNLLNLAD